MYIDEFMCFCNVHTLWCSFIILSQTQSKTSHNNMIWHVVLVYDNSRTCYINDTYMYVTLQHRVTLVKYISLMYFCITICNIMISCWFHMRNWNTQPYNMLHHLLTYILIVRYNILMEDNVTLCSDTYTWCEIIV